MSRAETERPRLDRLLAASGMEFTEEPLDPGARAVAGWRFRARDGDVEADVYIVDAAPGTLAAELRDSTELAGYNGAIVFAVRFTGPAEEAERGWFKAANGHERARRRGMR